MTDAEGIDRTRHGRTAVIQRAPFQSSPRSTVRPSVRAYREAPTAVGGEMTR